MTWKNGVKCLISARCLYDFTMRFHAVYRVKCLILEAKMSQIANKNGWNCEFTSISWEFFLQKVNFWEVKFRVAIFTGQECCISLFIYELPVTLVCWWDYLFMFGEAVHQSMDWLLIHCSYPFMEENLCEVLLITSSLYSCQTSPRISFLVL